MVVETASPGGEDRRRRGFKVTGAKDDDGGAPGAPVGEKGEDGEHSIGEIEAMLKDKGAKVEAHQGGDVARSERAARAARLSERKNTGSTAPILRKGNKVSASKRGKKWAQNAKIERRGLT